MLDRARYSDVQALHSSAAPYAPYIPTAALPYFAFVLLATTFVLAFYSSTIPKNGLPTRELGVAVLASILGGFGVVSLFCSVGVYV